MVGLNVLTSVFFTLCHYCKDVLSSIFRRTPASLKGWPVLKPSVSVSVSGEAGIACSAGGDDSGGCCVLLVMAA